jgi:hypothetical protein
MSAEGFAAGGVLFAIALSVGIALFVALLLVVIFALVARVTRAMAEKIAAEGVIHRSGPCFVTLRLRNYRSPVRYSSGAISKNRGELLLVRSGLVALCGIRVHRFAMEDLPHARVWNEAGRLHFVTEKPTGATGKVDIRSRLPDADEWVRLLCEHGAQPGAASA